MAITISKQPPTLSPVFSDNEYIFQETGVEHFDVVFSGSVTHSLRIPADSNGIAKIEARYILENYIYSQIVNKTDLTLPNAIKSYDIQITSSLGTVLNIAGKKYYNGTKQEWEDFQLVSGDLLNDRSKIFVHKNEELTLQKINGDNVDIINVVTDINKTVEGVDIEIISLDSRFPNFRFAYVNRHGGTDYVNFSLANSEKLKIKKNVFESDNEEVVYNQDIEKGISVISEVMREDESKTLAQLWVSPLVVYIDINGVHRKVILLNKTVNVFRDKQIDLIRYTIEFKYAHKVNVQR